MGSHPYEGLPSYRHWIRAFRDQDPRTIDPVVRFRFRIRPTDKVATAGSCFAQHISRYLRGAGFEFLVAEAGHPIASPEVLEAYNYGVFSGRYGNIYTSRQLLQLFDRAHGQFEPAETFWMNSGGRWVDPFRPTVEPGGFSCEMECLLDRERHLAAVRAMFGNLDYLVFTLGLTEAWESREDGAVFPLCPGVAGGEFDAGRHRFLNLQVEDVVQDIDGIVQRLRAVNPDARIILTVSPVPLMATAEDRHVLCSTTYSKSVLRVACDIAERRHANVAYFPSYEIVTGGYARGGYFADDLRSVTEDGVRHVMRLFLDHATERDTGSSSEKRADAGAKAGKAAAGSEDFISKMEEVVEVMCDEEMLRAM